MSSFVPKIFFFFLIQANPIDWIMFSKSIIFSPPFTSSFIAVTLVTLSVPFHKNLKSDRFNSQVISKGGGSIDATF